MTQHVGIASGLWLRVHTGHVLWWGADRLGGLLSHLGVGVGRGRLVCLHGRPREHARELGALVGLLRVHLAVGHHVRGRLRVGCPVASHLRCVLLSWLGSHQLRVGLGVASGGGGRPHVHGHGRWPL